MLVDSTGSKLWHSEGQPEALVPSVAGGGERWKVRKQEAMETEVRGHCD